MSKSYFEKLKDPRWQKKRLQILQRDGFKCNKCRDEESTLHVHHIQYLSVKNPWEYPNEYLVALCEGCHEEEEHYAHKLKDSIVKAYNLGLDNSDISILLCATASIANQDMEFWKKIESKIIDLAAYGAEDFEEVFNRKEILP